MMKTKKSIIKESLFNLFVNEFLKYEDFYRYRNSVKFLSKKSTEIWFNALRTYDKPEVREFYNH